jgi:AraC-like DNA-binding protein
MLYWEKVQDHLSANVYSLGDPTFLIIAPLLSFYVLELTGRRIRLRWSLLAHFAPFFCIVLLSLIFHFFQSERMIVLVGDHHRFLHIFFWMLVTIQFSGYLYFIHTTWLTHQKLMQQEVSNTEDTNISWVRFFLIVFLLINVSFLFSLFAVIQLDMCRGWLQTATSGVFSISIFALSFKGILQRDIFNTIPARKTVSATSVYMTTKPDQQQVDRLMAYMQEEKPYLDSELTLSTFSKSLGMNRNQLSRLINDHIGENFYDFVNKYRVEEVKRLMADSGTKNLNLLGIALEAGFKSKSTFNAIFKRFTGLTPTEYRKKHNG